MTRRTKIELKDAFKGTTLDQDKILGLMMHPEVLAHAREERSFFLTRAASNQKQVRLYFDLAEVRKEYRYCRELFERKGWDTVDVTRRAIEEVSVEILEKRGLLNGGDWEEIANH